MYLKKSLSQNFLIDTNVKINIIKKISLKTTDRIWEVGAGDGQFSDVYKYKKNVVLIEIDFNLSLVLKEENKLCKIYNDNVLKHKFYIKKKIRVIGNLPYNIVSKILFKLLKIKNKIYDMHFIIENNFYKKIKLDKNYFLGILINIYFNINKIFYINPGSFFPQPRVRSVFVKIIPKKNIKILNKNNLYVIIKNCLQKKVKLNKCFIRYFYKSKQINDLNNYIRLSNIYSVSC